MVPTTWKVVIEEFGGGPDLAQTGSEAVWVGSDPLWPGAGSGTSDVIRYSDAARALSAL